MDCQNDDISLFAAALSCFLLYYESTKLLIGMTVLDDAWMIPEWNIVAAW